MRDKDDVILLIVIIAIIAWLVIVVRNWLYDKKTISLPFSAKSELPEGAAVELLTRKGYAVLHGKHKVPIEITIDDQTEDPLYSHLFIDYYAEDDSGLYIVKLARERQPLNWSGSAIRDRFLALQLMYEEVSGILYVDVKHNNVYKIKFNLDEGRAGGT